MRFFYFLAIAATSTLLACAGSLQAPKSFDTAIQPGAIIERFSRPPKIEVVCTQADSVGQVVISDPATPSATPPGPEAVIVNVSPEPDFTQASSTDSQAAFDLGLAKVIGTLKANGKHVSKINYQATNVKGYTISLADVRKGAKKRNADCTAQIGDEAKRWALDLVTKAYVGDVTYTVEFENTVDAQAKAEITKEVAPSLGGSVDSTNSTKIVGKGVTWLAQSAPYGGRSGD